MSAGADIYGGLGASTGTTYVSVPGQPPNQSTGTMSPGASGPGSSLAPHQAAVLLITSSLVMLVVIGYVFRRGTID